MIESGFDALPALFYENGIILSLKKYSKNKS